MDIKQFCEDNGISETGFSKVDYVTKSGMELPYAVSLIVKLSGAVLDEIDGEPTYTYFQHYRTVNAYIDQMTFRVGQLIEKSGYNYIAVPASQSIPQKNYEGIFPHKTAAVAAGLGGIGKSGLFISKRYGPGVRLGTVLTDMPLEVEKFEYTEVCGACNLCVKSCPAMAITGKNYVIGTERSEIIDAAACSKHMKDKYQHIGRGSVCGICLSVCPKRC